MMVLRTDAELIDTVRRVAHEQPSYRIETRNDLLQAASRLERAALLESNPPCVIEAGLNILEDEA